MTDAERWIHFFVAALHRENMTPKDAASLADKSDEEFRNRFEHQKGLGWQNKDAKSRKT